MNKLFTKVATLCVGLAMVTGVGVALGSAKVSVAKAEASESVDFSQQGYTNTQVITEYEGTNFKITFEKGSGNNDPKYYTSGAAIRCYGGNKFTIESKDTDPLNEVSFTFDSGEGSNVISSDVPTYGNNKWSGTSQKVVFTIGGTSGHRRIKTVSVKTGSGGEVIVTHSVIFNANGENVSSMPETLTDKYGEVSLSGLSIPVRGGYSFMGWSLSASGEVVKSVEVSDSDVNVYAQWEAIPEVAGLHDVLTGTLIGVSNYTDWSGVDGSASSAVYGGNSTKNDEDAIQIRASSDHKDSGIFTTTSGGKIAAVQIKWNSNTVEDRKLEVYAKNTAYTVATELFNDETKGTKVGTLSRIGSTTLLIEDAYEYVGVRSNNGAIYLDELVFIWNSGQPVEVKYEVSFYEGNTGKSSEYAEGAKITMPQPTESLIPEGKEFDYWSHKETGDHYAPGAEFTVGKSSARFDAVYKDVEPVVTDWTADEKAAFSAALDGFVPPYFVTPASYKIEGNVVTVDYNELLSQQLNEYLLNGGWTPVQTETSGYAKKDTAHGEIRLTAGGSSTTTHIVYTFVASTPVEDWTDGQKTAFSAVLDGFVPPYFGPTISEPTINENNVMYSVAGDLSEQAEAYFADGWTNEGDYFTKQSANGVINGAAYPSGNSTYFLFQFIAGTPTPTEGWDSTMLGLFEQYLHRVVPTYAESVKTLEFMSNYQLFAVVVADEETANSAIATLCNGWDYNAQGEFYYAYSTDGIGFVRGFVYNMGDQGYWAVLSFNQTDYEKDMKDLFVEHLGVVPPYFAGFSNYIWYVDGFVCEYIDEPTNLASDVAEYKADLDYYGFTPLGVESRTVFVYNGGQSGNYPATVYGYGAMLQDGGYLIVELYTLFDTYLGFNIYYDAQPISLALSGDYKTSYVSGEEFSSEGMVVTALMSDGSQVDVTSEVTFDGFNTTVVGEQTITVSCANVSTEYTVTVTAPVPVFQGIEVTKMPAKTVYKLGEEFDPTGLEVSAVYDIGDPVVVDLSQVEISGFDSETLGEKTITLTYEGKSTSFVVVVAESYTANDFAQLILDQAAVICVNGGKSSNKAALLSAWTTLSQYYSLLDNEEKAKVVAAKGDVKGTVLEQAMAFYDYVVNKYKLANFVENRTIKAIVFDQPVETSNRPIIAIVAATFVAITAIGVIVALKRRKSLLIK